MSNSQRCLRLALAVAALLGGSLVGTSPASATTWNNQIIGVLTIDTRPCLFFQLTGVAQADPVVPNSPEFAVPTTAANYQTMVSMLLSAKLSGKPLLVVTDGTVSCGYATVVGLGFD